MSQQDLRRLIDESIGCAIAEPDLQRKWAVLQDAKALFDRLANDIWHAYITERNLKRPRDLS